MEEFIKEWGYWALYAGTTLEGEAMYLTGVITAKLGHLDFFWVAVCGFLGGMTRDMTIFFGSRYGGKKLIQNNTKLLEKLHKAGKWVSGRPWYLLAFHRFVYGLSTATLVVLSLSKMTNVQFILLCVLACFTWVVGYGVIGYFAAKQVMNNLDWLGNNYIWILLGVGIIIFTVKMYQKYKTPSV
jgi:membrane protein DedA with SNARE-associated domain